MAWTLVSSGAESFDASNTTTLGLALPSGLVTGNLMVTTISISLASGGAPSSITAPTGWTQGVYNNPSISGAVVAGGIWYRVIDGTETGTQTWSWTGSFNANGRILQWSGNASAPGDGGSVSLDDASTPSFTTTGADLVVLLGTAWFSGSATTPTAPTGWTLQWYDGSTNAIAPSAVCTLIQSAAGATGAQNVTWTNTGGDWVNCAYAFKPGAAGSSDPFPLLYVYDEPWDLRANAVYRR